MESAATRSRGRGGRGRRGRGRGGRRGGRGSRRGSRGFDDDGSGSESDLPASQQGDLYPGGADGLPGQTVQPLKMSVEQIYGWRWPSAEDAAADRHAIFDCAQWHDLVPQHCIPRQEDTCILCTRFPFCAFSICKNADFNVILFMAGRRRSRGLRSGKLRRSRRMRRTAMRAVWTSSCCWPAHADCLRSRLRLQKRAPALRSQKLPPRKSPGKRMRCVCCHESHWGMAYLTGRTYEFVSLFLGNLRVMVGRLTYVMVHAQDMAQEEADAVAALMAAASGDIRSEPSVAAADDQSPPGAPIYLVTHKGAPIFKLQRQWQSHCETPCTCA